MTSIRPTFGLALGFVAAFAGCHGSPEDGPTSFVSAPPGGSNGRSGGGAEAGAGGDNSAPTAGNMNGNATTTRTVEETDLYRLEGTRLYYLNSYRGLMVFDVADVDHPRLLGRSPIFGSPVDMVVHNGVATVVVADWYGQLEDGTPFRGSIVRGLDASDPTNIKVVGEARLGGWVRDDRVVGDVLYAVSVDYGWSYGWGYADAPVSSGVGNVSSGGGGQTITVSSVSFAGGVVKAVDQQTFPGYGGIFNVTPNSILLAHDATDALVPSTELTYLDISDPAGHIARRGASLVNGRVVGWGADNGRWNLDFADGKTAHILASSNGYYDGSAGYDLTTVDFTNPDAPAQRSALHIANAGWSPAARFDGTRLYLSPDGYYSTGAITPFQVFDLSDPAAPALAGTVSITGTVWNILPVPGTGRLFALGNTWSPGSYNDSVSLQYLDATDPKNPSVLAPCTFGNGWAWTPAAGTFKAFTMDTQKGLVVLPFSGWDQTTQKYNNGLQLIEFSATGARTAGAAHSRGWVERGIFVGTRLVSLSDLALSVVDYSNHDAPAVTAELTLARNIVTAQPQGATIAEVASDWWDNDVSTSEVRILPLANAEETADVGGAPTVTVDGVNARVFRNGTLAYIVTDVRTSVPCSGGGGLGAPGGTGSGGCYGRTQQVQVVDLSGATPVLRGKLALPTDTWGWYGWGWYGCFYWDWYGGDDVIQYAGDGLAFRRWEPRYSSDGSTVVGDESRLFVVDLASADAPALASTPILDTPDGWWGNMRMVAGTLYASHYEWKDRPSQGGWTVRYFVDPIDLSDRKNPHVAHKINVPGLLIGGSSTDPTILYTIDYRWEGNNGRNDLDVLRLHGSYATRIGQLTVDGWVGSTFIVGDTAYLSAQRYVDGDSSGSNGGGVSTGVGVASPGTGSAPASPAVRFAGNASVGRAGLGIHANGTPTGPLINLHAIDLRDPHHPVDRVASDQRGWGWLLDVAGDRAVVQSGWGGEGVDLYKLSDGAAPEFQKFVRTRGWGANSVSRQDQSLYLSSGYWGVQTIDLN